MTAPAASRTAVGVARWRAYHQLMDDDPKILVDPIALRLLEPGAEAGIRAAVEAADAPESRALRSRIVLRSRYAEDRLAYAVARGVTQCVILGAGLDTFAYRQPTWARALRILEVDHAATQTDKRSRLAAAGIPAPENLTFVTIDFERASLDAGLRAGGVDFTRPTLFSCLGVLVYLTQEAVDEIFRLASRFPTGSEIVFTFRSSEGGEGSNGALASRVAAAGEPWLNRLDPEALEHRLKSLGFGPVDFLDHAEATRRYFPQPRRDGLEPPRVASIAAAVVG